MSFEDAKETIEELLFTQHPRWRPDFLEVTDRYIAFDLGSSSRSDASFWVPGRVHAKTKQVGGRMYYSRISRIDLIYWKRKLYIVRVGGDVSVKDRNLLRTKKLDEAKLFYDALASIIAQAPESPVTSRQTEPTAEHQNEPYAVSEPASGSTPQLGATEH